HSIKSSIFDRHQHRTTQMTVLPSTMDLQAELDFLRRERARIQRRIQAIVDLLTVRATEDRQAGAGNSPSSPCGMSSSTSAVFKFDDYDATSETQGDVEGLFLERPRGGRSGIRRRCEKELERQRQPGLPYSDEEDNSHLEAPSVRVGSQHCRLGSDVDAGDDGDMDHQARKRRRVSHPSDRRTANFIDRSCSSADAGSNTGSSSSSSGPPSSSSVAPPAFPTSLKVVSTIANAKKPEDIFKTGRICVECRSRNSKGGVFKPHPVAGKCGLLCWTCFHKATGTSANGGFGGCRAGVSSSYHKYDKIRMGSSVKGQVVEAIFMDAEPVQSPSGGESVAQDHGPSPSAIAPASPDRGKTYQQYRIFKELNSTWSRAFSDADKRMLKAKVNAWFSKRFPSLMEVDLVERHMTLTDVRTGKKKWCIGGAMEADFKKDFDMVRTGRL
ncbi:hypothetical protein HK101_007129, partial [Irineochytrium annulatum]